MPDTIMFCQEPVGNYTDVDLSFMYDYVRKSVNFTDYQDVTAFGTVLRFALRIGFMCGLQLSSPAVQDFLR
jgi:hypothetical protein